MNSVHRQWFVEVLVNPCYYFYVRIMSVINAVLPDDLKSTGIQQWFFGISPLRTEISPDSLFLILCTADGEISKVFTILRWNSETLPHYDLCTPIYVTDLMPINLLSCDIFFQLFFCSNYLSSLLCPKIFDKCCLPSTWTWPNVFHENVCSIVSKIYVYEIWWFTKIQ